MSNPMRATGTNVVPFVSKRRDEYEPGGWLAAPQAKGEPVLRDRVGKQATAALFGYPSHANYPQLDRLLDGDQLFTVYQRTPDVRAAVDSITRRVATWDWMVEPTVPSTDVAQHSVASEAAAAATRFLEVPNEDGETWQELITKVVTDMLVFDAGCIEHVFDSVLVGEVLQPGSNLKELVALRGASVHPIVDPYGKLEGYVQTPFYSGGAIQIPNPEVPGSTNDPVFKPRQITFLRTTPTTSTPEGMPLIEALVNEVITVLRSSEHIMLAVDVDEIPPGILVLTGIAGKAAEAAKSDLQKLRGKDHKIRVVTNADPQAVGARWVELRRTPKDVDFVNVIREVRRTIWRVFGVMPVEMGSTEDVPRAVGQVQLDVSASHLIGPLLELLETKINARILPLVLGDPALVKLVRFRFDRDAKLTPAEEQQRADAMGSLVDRAIITRDEARARLGLPPIAGGNIPALTTGQGVLKLTDAVGLTSSSAPEPEPSPATETEPVATVESVRTPVHHHGDGCVPSVRSAHDMPSDWQPEGRFDGVRTVDLSDLQDAVASYFRTVEPMWNEAMDEVVSIARSEWTEGGYTDDGARDVNRRTGDALDRLEARWRAGSASFYERATGVGVDAARQFSGLPVLQEWKRAAADYHAKAMSYLGQPGGLISDLRARLIATVQQTSAGVQARAASLTPPSTLDPSDGLSVVLSGFASAFEANHPRIDNWTGKLVELAQATLTSGLTEAGTVLATGPEVTGPVPAEWWVEWVSVGDRAMCETCTREGAKPFRPVAELPTMPGGATECGAMCRCVLVMWTRQEVEGGEAVSLKSGRR